MNRIPELRYSLFAARSTLRQRFSMLPASPVARHHVPSEQGDLPRDSDVVQLLLDTTQTLHCDQATAMAEYQRIQAQSPNGLPDHVEAEARGWFRRINGKWVAAQALRDVYLRDGPPFAPELRDYVWWLSESQYHVSRQGLHASAKTLETALTTGTATSQGLPDVLSPDWIAARLWDTPQAHDLPLWTIRWKALECPSVIPKLAWSADHVDQFRALVLKALHQGNLPGWDAIDMSDALRSSGDIRQAFVDEIPADALGRHLRQIHTPSAEALFEPEGLALLMGVLARELPQIEAGPVPSPTAQELVGLALRHPDLLATLVDCALEAPQLLADLVLCPPATALVCYLVATWGPPTPDEPESPQRRCGRRTNRHAGGLSGCTEAPSARGDGQPSRIRAPFDRPAGMGPGKPTDRADASRRNGASAKSVTLDPAGHTECADCAGLRRCQRARVRGGAQDVGYCRQGSARGRCRHGSGLVHSSRQCCRRCQFEPTGYDRRRCSGEARPGP